MISSEARVKRVLDHVGQLGPQSVLIDYLVAAMEQAKRDAIAEDRKADPSVVTDCGEYDHRTHTVSIVFADPVPGATLPDGIDPTDIILNTQHVTRLVFVLLMYGMDVDVLIQRITAEQ